MNYLFYRLYKFQTFVVERGPWSGAYGVLSILEIINVFTVEIILFKRKQSNLSTAALLVICFFVFAANYFLFYKKRKQIEKKYRNEPAYKSKRGAILAWSYILLSFTLLFLSVAC